MTAGQVIIVQGPDGDEMRDRVVALIESMQADGGPIEVITERVVPDTWDNAVVAFLATPGAFADLFLPEYLNRVVQERLPLLPIVDDIRRFNFRAIPQSFAAIGERNAKGLQPDDGKAVEAAVRENLGLESKYRMRKVFISYRRVDGAEVASAIRAYLWSKECPAFLDTLGVEGGAPVQEVIVEELMDKDFVLFIDSPRAAESVDEARWITEELNTALQMRIPVAVVRIDPPRQHITLLGPAPAVEWDPTDDRRLEKVFRLVSRGIASRSSLDDRVERTLAHLAQGRRFELRRVERDRRRFELVWPDRLVRVEYEDASVTLERLHRLYRWYDERPPEENKRAIYVCGDYLVLPPTQEALAWASQSYPLSVATLEQVVELIQAL